VNVDTETGGPLYGASVPRFRAAAPNVSEADIYKQIPVRVRKGRAWEAFQPFIATSIGAVAAGTFNNRFDAHLTVSPLLLDDIGWTQTTNALQRLEDTLSLVEADLGKRRRREGLKAFEAGFLLSSFQAPQRESRRSF
jgi:hypothetical protein